LTASRKQPKPPKPLKLPNQQSTPKQYNELLENKIGCVAKRHHRADRGFDPIHPTGRTRLPVIALKNEP